MKKMRIEKMMKGLLLPLIAGTCFICGADESTSRELQALSMQMNRDKRWDNNSSGKATHIYNMQEKSIKFSVKFKKGTDYWIYPQFHLNSTEYLNGTGIMSFELKAENPDVRCAFVMLSPGKRIPYKIKGNDWQKISVNLEASGIDLAKVKSIKVGMNPKQTEYSFQIRNIEMKPGTLKINTSYALTCKAPGTVFTEGSPLVFTLRSGSLCPDKYIVLDFWEKIVESGNWPDKSNKLVIKQLPPGYYRIELKGSKCNFTGIRSFVVVTNPNGLKHNPNSFYALDTAQSWLARADKRNTRFPGDAFELVSNLCKLSGTGMIRERMSWRGVDPTGKRSYKWNQYMKNADLLSIRGVEICGMFHDSPKWSRYPSEGKSQGQTNMPDDLLATWHFTKDLAQTFKGKMSCWEFWNEQDHHNHKETPWDFAAATKAAYLGFKAGNPDIPVLCGSFCMYPLSPKLDLFFENGGAEYMDIFNYHIYMPLKQYPKIIGNLKKKLKDAGIPDMAIYITENGTNAESNCTIPSYIPGIKAHSEEQNQVVAEFVPKSQILLQSLGISRDFFFVLLPYNERDGIKDWGLLRRDYSAKPGYAAFANLTRQLNNGEYLGTYDLGKDSRGFLYKQPDGSQTLALWTISGLDNSGDNLPASEIQKLYSEKIEIPVADGKYEVSDIFGKTRIVTSVNGKISIEVTKYISYINGLSGLKPSVPVLVKRKIGAEKLNRDLSVIIKPYFSGKCKINAPRTAVELSGDKCKLRLEVFNLSKKSKTGSLSASGIKVTGLPSEIKLLPMSKTVIETECIPNKALSRLHISGRFDNCEITPLVVPICSIKGLLNGKREPVAVERASRWRTNTSGKMTINKDENEQAIRFDVEFTGGEDRWVYPEYVLDLPRESFEDCAGIEFEIKADSNDKCTSILMLVMENVKETGKSIMLRFASPSTKWEKRTIFFDDTVEADKIKVLRIGMNPHKNNLSYRIRNVKRIKK